MANGQWRLLFPRALVHHLPRYAFDHEPILLDLEGGSSAGPRPFRFEQFWAKDPRSFGIVAAGWCGFCPGSLGFVLCDKIRQTRLALQEWNREDFGHIQQKIHLLEQNLDRVQSLVVLIMRRIGSVLLELCLWSFGARKKFCGRVNPGSLG
ncbi:hypothetical protein CJ030_MR4G018826 [Morella rubra]|uniref:Uncharacterized protein n=1 Tax=Morella rubra TaxID=262757 RepID=A0A6A1VQ45_9ROSI|nr:hypothetical protein CJ030_MR4G018826 [Morella rubra]